MNIQDWTLYYDNFGPLSCQAPCTMYSVLYDHGKIPDPFYGTNERELQYLAEKDCVFESVFSAPPALLTREHIELVFHGLDTICHIYLNGTLLGKVKNMHREYVYEVKPLLTAGENTLRLEFKSPRRYFAQQQHKHYLYMNDGDTLPGAAHLRKAMYQSGWDWGPTLPDMGIFRGVELKGWNVDRFDGVAVRQHHENGSVSVELDVTTKCHAGCEIYADFDGKRVLLKNGHGIIKVDNPKLWWARGYGDQPLYDLDVELVCGGEVIDRCHKQLGLRTLTVSTEPDADGKGSEFCFVLNGVKIFSMGANLVPMDNLLSRITDQRWETIVRQAVDANFNTLRVWGGGYYPDSRFYELCDQYGLLVWQDFMVACANIYLTSEMAEEFTQEAICNLKRLHHHASLALLCGNNEMESGVINWGSRDNQLVRDDYTRLYGHLLPELCETYAPDTYYWPSSPSSGGGFDDPDNPAKGDTHYWEVWHGGVPFTTYRQKRFRFCSEYGFESFPSMKTIRTFAREEDMNCFSRVMENHQKCRGGNGKILRYLADNYLYPAAFENLVYASQLLQADAIKYGVEHFRRQRGYCMGSTYWQFNDCWPVASWSSVDCFGRYKALHYAARKFYAPVAMGLFLENGALTVNIANETRAGFRGHIHLAMCRGNLTVLDGLRRDVEVEALSSRDVLTYRVDSCDPYDTFLYADLYDEQGRFLMRQVELLVPAKHFRWRKPAFDVRIAPVPGGAEISVQADVFAKGVFLDFRDFDCVLSDNFFALTAPAPYRVTVQTSRSVEELEQNLTIKSVYDIR